MTTMHQPVVNDEERKALRERQDIYDLAFDAMLNPPEGLSVIQFIAVLILRCEGKEKTSYEKWYST